MSLEQARFADQEIKAGKSLGPLHGIPLAHKDMYYRQGRISACGSKIMANKVAEQTSTALARLDEAGALDVARLMMVEFALGITGHNDVAGTPLNPWNTAHMTGGSSSGSGVAVAAGLVYGALGSDTGGSIRFPASCCGVVGMKPTWGRVSRFGAMPLSHSLDTVGPLTRTVSDNALIMQAIAGHDPQDPTSSPHRVPDYSSFLKKGVKGLKVGMPENYFYDPVVPEIEKIVRTSLDVLKECGAELVPVRIPDSITDTNAMTSIIISSEGAALHAKWMQERPQDYGPQTLGRFSSGLFLPATRYQQAINLRQQILAEFQAAVFEHVDILHLPVMIVPVPTAEEVNMTSRPGYLEFIGRMGHCTRPINYMGLPSLTVPCGFTTNGLPTSFQLVGRPYDEATLYQAGHAYQNETDWPNVAPAFE